MFDRNERMVLAETLKNPGMIAMMGPVYGADNYTVGAMYSNTMFLWVAIAVAAMNFFLVTRHTRDDEENGRAEVIRSLPTGRLATLNATMITALIVNSLLAVGTGLGIAVQGIEAMDFAGSMLYGAALGAVGLFFAAAAAVFSQLSVSSRGAIVYSFSTLFVIYMIRAAGDIGNETLSLISPLGLVQRSKLFVENNCLPVIVVIAEAIAVAAAAYVLNAVRDIDRGFITAGPGRKEASVLLRSSSGLAVRLLRNSIIGWIIILFALSASYGAILADIDAFVSESDFYRMVIGVSDDYTILEMFTATANIIGAIVALVPMLIITLKPRSEEKEGRAEGILARSVSRIKYIAGYTAPAFAASVLFQLATAFGLYASSAAVLDEPISLAYLLRANLVFLPAQWVMIGIAVFLTGLLPKITGAIWAYFAFSFFTEFIGRMLNIPEWLSKTTPFGYTPQLPVDEIDPAALVALIGIAAVLTISGFVLFKRRDVTT